jgi:hypothetical protein
MVPVPGRSSDSWFVLLPAPSHLPSDVCCVTSDESLFRLFQLITVHCSLITVFQTVALAGFVPIHSGGTARDSHPLPLPGNHDVSGTLGDRVNSCQVH